MSGVFFASSFGGAPLTFSATASCAFPRRGAWATNASCGLPAAVTVTVNVATLVEYGLSLPTLAMPGSTFTSLEALASRTTQAIGFLPWLATLTLTLVGTPTGSFTDFGASTKSGDLVLAPGSAVAPAASARQ